MKKKKYCAQRHLKGTQIQDILCQDVFHFIETDLRDRFLLLSMEAHAHLCRISVSSKEAAYSLQKSWVNIKDSGFWGRYVAWVLHFTVTLGSFYAVYKVKTGERLIIPASQIKINECLSSKF